MPEQPLANKSGVDGFPDIPPSIAATLLVQVISEVDPQPYPPLELQRPQISIPRRQPQLSFLPISSPRTAIMAAAQGGAISKRRKFVADGVFYAELNEFFQRELAEEGYSGVEVRVTPTVTDISYSPHQNPAPILISNQQTVIRATHTQEVLGEQGRRIRELTSLIQKRFKFPENSVSLYAAKVQNRGLSAVAQCESLRYKLLNGLAVRRACYGVLRFIMESGAKGCEVVVSGKLRAARAKSMKFTVR